jgi:hypothetical protein
MYVRKQQLRRTTTNDGDVGQELLPAVYTTLHRYGDEEDEEKGDEEDECDEEEKDQLQQFECSATLAPSSSSSSDVEDQQYDEDGGATKKLNMTTYDESVAVLHGGGGDGGGDGGSFNYNRRDSTYSLPNLPVRRLSIISTLSE